MASILRFQGGARPRGPIRAPAVLLIALGLGMFAPALAARDLCRFEAAGLAVGARDTTADGGLGVEIDVAEGPLVLTRVAIPADEGGVGCWQLDLDGDQRFEIIVGIVQAGGTVPPRLSRFEWNGQLLEALPMALLEPEQGEGYAGNDRLEMRGGELIRSFDVRTAGNAAREIRHFRYAPDADRWIALQALKRESATGDKGLSP